MIASKQERVAAAAEDRLHPPAVRFHARRASIVKPSPVHRAPEVCIELEIGAAPFLTHRAEDLFEMLLRLGVRAVHRIPRTSTPAAERHAIGAKRLAAFVLDEPVAVLLEKPRSFLRNEGRHPDGRLES